MKKRITQKEQFQNRVINRIKKENPSDINIGFIKQFARVYLVEKGSNGSFVELILN